MNSAMEYLLLSTLSYGDFSNMDRGRTLEELFYGGGGSRERITKNSKGFLTDESAPHLFEFFKEVFREWEVYYVDNRTEHGKNFYSKASGFYAVVFKNKDKYVISYRGSERFPLEDAYKDFVETDLLLGMGKRPQQFMEGFEVYEDLLELLQGESENISITGHSLGGGIAQFVAIMADKNGYTIPYTCTWNAVGINKSGIIGIDDFIDFDGAIREVYPFKSEEIGALIGFKEAYMEFLMRELKRKGYIKDRGNIKVTNGHLVHHEIKPENIAEFVKSTKLNKHVSSLSIATRRGLFRDQEFVRKLLTLPELGKSLLEAKNFIEKVRNNKAYEDVVVNFCHSKDLTISLFNHVGSVYLIDREFEQKEVRNTGFMKNIFLFTKSVKDYHLENVFLPFLVTEGSRRGRFSRHLNIDFIASLLRKVIHFAGEEDKALLIRYYKREDVQSDTAEDIKKLLLEGVGRCKENLLYREQALKAIEDFNAGEVRVIWEKVKEKLVSPYEARDLFDIILFGGAS